MSPVPPLTHLAALAAALLCVLTVMPSLAPDLPGEDVTVQADAGTVFGPGASGSMFQGSVLSTALGKAFTELADNQRIVSLTVTPTALDIDSSDSDDGVEVSEVVASAPEHLAYAIAEARRGGAGGGGPTDIEGVGSFESFEFEADGSGGVWTAHLADGVAEPYAYRGAVPRGAVAHEVEVKPVPGA